MYTTPQLVTLALSLMNISFSDQISALSKSCYSLIRALNYIRPYLDHKKQLVPSPHPLSILNLTTATPFIIFFLTPKYTNGDYFTSTLTVASAAEVISPFITFADVFRFIAKICLNSLWGKFAKNPKVKHSYYIDNEACFYSAVLSDN